MRLFTTRSLVCGVLTSAGLALAGCAGDDTSQAPATATSATATASAGSGTVASCVVGDWRSTALPPDTEAGTVNADLTGGAGIGVRIQASGATTIGFGDMQPITFSARIGDAEVRGTFRYDGQATGTITTDPGGAATDPPTTASPAPEQTGTWQPQGDLNWDDTTFTLELTEPVQARPFDDVPLGRYTGAGAEQSGNVVDVDPFFDRGRYTCQADRLIVTPDDDGDLPLVLQRN